jgi:hypothetical protein
LDNISCEWFSFSIWGVTADSCSPVHRFLGLNYFYQSIRRAGNLARRTTNFFSTFYRTIQQAMIAGERLLELFKIKPSIVDPPGVFFGTLFFQHPYLSFGHSFDILFGILSNITSLIFTGTSSLLALFLGVLS